MQRPTGSPPRGLAVTHSMVPRSSILKRANRQGSIVGNGRLGSFVAPTDEVGMSLQLMSEKRQLQAEKWELQSQLQKLKLDMLEKQEQDRMTQQQQQQYATANFAGAATGVAALEANMRKYPVVLVADQQSETAGRCRSVQKIVVNLGVEERTELMVVYLDARSDGPQIAQALTHATGYSTVPLLFVGGECIGDYNTILSLVRKDQLRTKLMDAGVQSVVGAIPTATLSANIYGYPKALADGQHGKRENTGHTLNVLIACCGSSAADKIPTLVEKCVAQNWAVKLICTTSGEHFWKSFGSQRVIDAIGAENIYRDEDEWSFEYDAFDMPVRACHLAIRKWADIMVVAPITCNSMAKACAGVGDNLLSSVLVAWEYHKKSIIFCPACNVDMWKNAPTQRNVAFLKTMGVTFLGPRVDRLTNGQVAIGCMETVDNIVARLQSEEGELLTGNEWYFRRAISAATADDEDLWQLVLRAVEENLLDVNAQSEENGNTLLHLAAGGESYVDGHGEAVWGTPDMVPLKTLIDLGANLDIQNDFHFTPLHCAIATGDKEAIQALVDAGADCSGALVQFANVSPDIRAILEAKPESKTLGSKYYFTYGSLKRGFPNYENHASHLQTFVGEATTVEDYPLVVPFKPSCSNPHCPYLHQQASLCNQAGTGMRVVGEVFAINIDDIIAFDRLEGFNGMGINGNVYSRRLIDVDVKGLGVVPAFCYFSTSEDPLLQVAAGEAEFISEYKLEMAKGDLKPGYEEKVDMRKKRRSTIISSLSSRPTISNLSTRSTMISNSSSRSMNSRVSFESSIMPPTRASTGIDSIVEEDDAMLEPSDARTEPSDATGTTHRRLTKTPVGHFDALLAESIGSVQQAINTCNLASVSLALKGLGIDCSIDNIFSALRLPTSWVVEEGLTLAQVFDVMVKLCGGTNVAELLAPGIAVDCFHLDAATANFSAFKEYLRETMMDDDDVLIVNFSTAIARKLKGGGGHFSLVSGFDDATNTVSIADVHPKKYGAHWACDARELFDAMVDQDSAIKRSRGMIRVSFAKANHIACLDGCRHTISFRDRSFDRAEQEWLSRWGDLPVGCFESHLNMGGLSCLGLCLSGFLSEVDYIQLALQNHIPADFIAWQLRLNITELLGKVMTPRALANYARRTSETLSLELDVQCETVDLSTPNALASSLETRVGLGSNSVALILVDLNQAFGFEVRKAANKDSEAAALDHGVQHWCILVSVLDQQTAIIADPQSKAFGRLWKCKMENLRNGLLSAETDPGTVIFVSHEDFISIE